jgi:signal transduction histidine kinase
MPDKNQSAAAPVSAALLAKLESAPERHVVEPLARPVPRWLKALLRIPLAAKLAGANVLIVLVAFAASFAALGTVTAAEDILLIVALALAGSFVVNVVLIFVALRPLEELEMTATRVWRGDFDARVRLSLLADWRVARVGSTMNLLLDGLTTDRARTRRLASEIIGAGDRERAYIARELHDSVAQSLAALVMQLGAAARDSTDPSLTGRIESIREIGSDALEEVRMLAHTMHPRVLDDLGLVAALENLARQVGERANAVVTVEVEGKVEGDSIGANDVPPAVASVLYRIAQEAVSNALRHGHAKAVNVSVRTDSHTATLEIRDDGRGFDVPEAEQRRPGMGLFTMQERVSLVNGQFEVLSHPGGGTRVVARIPIVPLPGVPLEAPAAPVHRNE